MAFKEINEMLQDTISAMKRVMSTENVIGASIIADDTTIIPVSKLSCGFVTGGYDMQNKTAKLSPSENSREPIGAVGGGVTLTPIGFLTVSNDCVHFIKTQGDNIDKWLDIVQEILKQAIK